MKRIALYFVPATGISALLVPAVMILIWGTGHAFAQNTGGTRGLSVKHMEQSTELQVKCVARELGLDETDREKLREITLKSRKRLMDAMVKRLDEGVEDNAVLMSDVYVMQVKEKKNLLEAVSGFLNEEQRGRVGQTLGSYNLQWDSYILELNKLGLSPDVLAKAEARLMDYVTSYSPVRDEGYLNGDLSFVLKGMVTSKQALDRDLKKILPDAEYARWTKNTELRFRGPER